ncbi:hypothetical protein [Maridesulfovibrio sp. FT414]|uniref:hypothetical protein n=1 Tax=Maridesulfovibrio sp. FT414 TaxID=2979469 RepID=UPI003D8018C0
MIIDASAIKNNLGVPGLLDNGSPFQGGSRTSGVRATRLNVSAPPVNTADQFAEMIAQKTVAPDQTGKTQKGAEEGEQTSKNPSELTGALSRAAEFIEGKFGSEAATAFKGIVIANSGDRITEESLSNGLLKSVQFIDRNFGFAAGDAVMEHFNSDLNTAINGYFENGLQEHFFAAEPGTSARLTMQNTFAQLNEQFGEETVKSIESLIEQVLNDEGNSLSSLKKGLQKGLDEAEKTSPGISDIAGPMAAGEIMDKLQSTTSVSAPAPGSILNIAV